ncbi:MAG: deoxyribose-phosphate aldolase [Erysipelotrichaceae bacterium]
MQTLDKPLASYFDHTILKPFATKEEILKVAEECRIHHFAMLAINSYPVSYCKEYLKDSDVHVGAAIGFPLGQMTIEAKVFEAIDAIHNGADEIDYVLNIGEVKAGNFGYIEAEIERMVNACHKHKKLIKVIFENAYLTKDEIRKCAEIARKVRPDYIKTSTGFGPSGATLEDVKLMKETVGSGVKVKTAGGIRDLVSCLAMIEAGAERIGSSSCVKILEEYAALKEE